MLSFGNKSWLPIFALASSLTLASLASAQDKFADSNSDREQGTASSAATSQQSIAVESNGTKATQATKDLGGTATSPKNTKGVPVKKVSSHTDKMNKQTAKAVNKIPGVNIQASDLQPPAEDPPITGFHPIKKLMRPVIRLGKGAVEIQQSMMKLEGPIAGLHPSMTALDHKMTSVDHQMAHMQKQLSDMGGNVDHINAGLEKVGSRVDEVRADIGGMTQQVKHLTTPVKALQTPLYDLMEPLRDVTKPMSEVHGQLAELHTMLHWVLVAIVVSVLAITIGTPLAGVYVYRNRKKLFPHLREPGQDLPLEALKEKHLSAV
jgi:septal ring factor EnvC (AmiA/AmiB activator)